MSLILPKEGSVPLADKKMATISGEVVVDIEMGGHKYSNVVVNVIDNLFIDLIVGKDIRVSTLLKGAKFLTFLTVS